MSLRKNQGIVSLLLTLYFYFVKCSEIETVSDANIHSFFRSRPAVVLKIGAPWCTRSIHLGPQFNAAAHEVSARFSDATGVKAVFAEADGTLSPVLRAEWQVDRYPVIALVSAKGKNVQRYNGERTASAIANWVTRSISPVVKHLKSWDAVSNWANSFSPLFIARISHSDKSVLADFEASAAAHKSDAVFTVIIDDGPSELRVYRKDEGHAATLTDLSKASIEAFIKREYIPLVGRISSDNYATYLQTERPVVWFIGSGSEYLTMISLLQNVATSFRYQVLFVWLSTETHRDHAWASLGVAEVPAFLFQAADKKLYSFPGQAFSADVASLEKFVKAGLSGQLPEHHRSQPLTLDNNSRITATAGKSRVQSIVADNFASHVFTDKDTLVAVLAPWGVSSPRLEVAMDQYGKEVVDADVALQNRLNLVKIDGTKNDVQQFEGFKISRYPAVFYVRANERVPMKYSGPETVDGISMFVQRASTGEMSAITITE